MLSILLQLMWEKFLLYDLEIMSGNQTPSSLIPNPLWLQCYNLTVVESNGTT